jgi:hypothetical protein
MFLHAILPTSVQAAIPTLLSGITLFYAFLLSTMFATTLLSTAIFYDPSMAIPIGLKL